ncbi:tetratricopeptide repeat protein [Desulfospira joergensenii]|uniref:tetratricopeptide repeat protein n=1 Tax=Desulfospira joergensenii TaxID=53329 RepID=UPI00041A186E|nr:tetratricopeptide repeat protein [Desulfospira joergensenii]
MVQKQTLYMAVLISLTIGFLAGAAYTSFKLADQGPEVAAQAGPHDPDKGENAEGISPEVGANILKLEEHLKKNPDDARAWTELGNLFFDTHRPADAIEAYTKALALEPGKPGVLTDLGVMYRRSGQPEKAVEAFDKAIQADPSFETARFNKGIVLMHDLEDMEAAVQAWEDLVKINPMALAPNGEPVKNLIDKMKSR